VKQGGETSGTDPGYPMSVIRPSCSGSAKLPPLWAPFSIRKVSRNCRIAWPLREIGT